MLSFLTLLSVGSLIGQTPTGFSFSPSSGCPGSSAFTVTVTSNGNTSSGLFFQQATTTIVQILTPTTISLSSVSVSSPTKLSGSLTIPSGTPSGVYSGVVFHDVAFDLNSATATAIAQKTWRCTNCFTISGTFPFYVDGDGDGFGSGQAVNLCAPNASSPPTGYSTLNTDCNDKSAAIKPGASEICDGVDNNCNGSVDEGVLNTYYRDADGDTYGNASIPVQACSAPNGYVNNNTDCDDSKSAVKPGAVEICDGIDNNCNGTIDEGVKSIFFRDADGDGFGNRSDSISACSAPAGYVSNKTDCDDSKSTVRPGAIETCDGLDNNCNGVIDEGVKSVFYRDADGDNFGNGSDSVIACNAPAGYVANKLDCDDTKNAVKPGASEICDGLDNNCNGTTDEGVKSVFYRDADGDGFGNRVDSISACSAPAGYVANKTDCDDSKNSVKPGGIEVCDDLDNNCNGTIDEGVKSVFYRDADGDGFGDRADSAFSCRAPAGYVANKTDCDDNNKNIKPGAVEVCDNLDNNCNGTVDEGLKSVYYRDADGDGFGNARDSVVSCTPLLGYVANNKDCNDTIDKIKPDATEICDGLDNNCDGQIDETGKTVFYQDLDGDGFGNRQIKIISCTVQTGYVADSSDCNDSLKSINPKAKETCDGIDNNCDGLTDEGVKQTFYKDQDGDGYGNKTDSILACSVPTGFVNNKDDCNDHEKNINPSLLDNTCNGIDENCNGKIDESYVPGNCLSCLNGHEQTTTLAILNADSSYLNISNNIFLQGFPDSGRFYIDDSIVLINNRFNPSEYSIGEHMISYAVTTGPCQGKIVKKIKISMARLSPLVKRSILNFSKPVFSIKVNSILPSGFKTVSEKPDVPEQISIYPNPTRSLLKIQFQRDVYDKPFSIFISNLNGQVLYRHYIESSGPHSMELYLDKLNINSGIYFLSISGAEYRSIFKIIYQSP